MQETFEGTVLVGPEFEAVEGRVVVDDGEIASIEEESVASDDIVLPAFTNAHTHIGDSIAKEAGRGMELDELVAPPDGLKHRLLRRASSEEKVAAMRRSLQFMAETGTVSTIEFREGGVEGVENIREAADGTGVDPFVLGREDEAVLEIADGFGASGPNDGDFTRVRNATREQEKFFGIHAGERDDSDINPAMDLDPDMLVHMVHADTIHLERLADADIPVAVCPRSNLVTNVGTPDVNALLETTTVALGTDNVMLNSPSMFREMEFTAKVCGVDAVDVLHMATRAGAEIIGADRGVVEEGRPADLLVLDGDTDNLAGYRDAVRAVVRRAGASDVTDVHAASVDQ
ncbi:amidohydrolase family protein [Halocalculus aciditolerans]|uniref:Nucleoside deaminase n=1 Tax=Halocalculus aciditolerans TaxID=1383812 RepID=A0A830F9C8_9EURY|nr:amidohydrolase family protein [Halocalculus aciditolerans]GGL52756.1 nucleoside deaminase [Halocalculus aciditolerans]